jgi:hypothetical protein
MPQSGSRDRRRQSGPQYFAHFRGARSQSGIAQVIAARRSVPRRRANSYRHVREHVTRWPRASSGAGHTRQRRARASFAASRPGFAFASRSLDAQRGEQAMAWCGCNGVPQSWHTRAGPGSPSRQPAEQNR